VTSNPLERHSDDDGLPDGVEVRETHTHPQREQSYAVTTDHERRLQDLYEAGYRQWAAQMDAPAPDSEAVQRENGRWSVNLNDATDVFDAQASGAIDQFTFTALNGTERTDTWLSNSEEVDEGTDA